MNFVSQVPMTVRFRIGILSLCKLEYFNVLIRKVLRMCRLKSSVIHRTVLRFKSGVDSKNISKL
ncbi:hypothetical protein LEP1GSC043_1529 [Leptospira weilii str. Ecochallenge]|uniref:Uncharacterized protein n=1 Tax=Leptospira weilii str. Ecochallenge TaxID=1049986 RepID=N1U4D0_9LEPT|nr:hypothetical protein LEP1GSC043_1529 [Leptospira weilii str. Ecochallenge]